jgi:hypothetical protein
VRWKYDREIRVKPPTCHLLTRTEWMRPRSLVFRAGIVHATDPVPETRLVFAVTLRGYAKVGIKWTSPDTQSTVGH